MKHVLLICLLLISIPSHAALNKWVDAEGKVHYSDTPPADAKAKTVRTYTAPDSIAPSSEESAPKSLAEKEAEWKKTQKTKDEADKKAAQEKENAAIKQKNCENSRKNLATLENSPAIVSYNEKGERSLMDEASRKQSIEDARKAVSSYCN